MTDRPALETLLAEIRACRACAAALPLGPRPVLRASPTARIAICSQAPGTRVHETGLPFNDRSGDRLRDWLGIDRATFYDESRISIVPMGFCYPGVDRRGGDRPPRPECARLWHPRLFRLLRPDLIVVIGLYAMAYHMGPDRKPSLTETVQSFREYLPGMIPLPHPSWRNTGWIRRNPWFERDLLPCLRAEVARRL